MANNRTGKNIADEIDALFQLPLSEFIEARKTLAARLKKDRRADDAHRVKALPKLSISVWATNQLYWRHRTQFDQLLAAGQQFRRAQAAGKVAQLNEALAARRDALNELSELAAKELRDAGHNPGLDTMRRIATTLEAMSAYNVLPEDQTAGRLTKDLDPPGFESLAPFIRAVPTTARIAKPSPATQTRKPSSPAPKTKQASATTNEARRDEDARQTKLAAAKASLQEARKSLVAARTKTHTLEVEQKKAEREAKEAEKRKREAEAEFKEAAAQATDAAIRAQNLAREADRATKSLDDAERAVEQASSELESLMRTSRAK